MANSKLIEYLPNNYVDYSDNEGHSRISRIRERFSTLKSAWSQQWLVAKDDDRFVAGEQWSEKIKRDREDAGRPCLTLNLLPTFCDQVQNKILQDMPQVHVKPVQSDKPDLPKFKNKAGSQDYSIAEVYQGIWRQVERSSRAKDCYDTAVGHCVNHGHGFLMLSTEWNPTHPWVQDIKIKRVRDAYSIYIDPECNEADFSDMADAFVISRMSVDTYKRKFPKASHEGFDVASYAGYKDWYNPGMVTVATYWWVDWREDEVVLLSNGEIMYMSDVKPVLDEAKRDFGTTIAVGEDKKEIRKKVRRPVAMWQQMTALEFLSKEMESVFHQPPIFPVVGREIRLDNSITYLSAIRHAKDPQMSYNYHETAAVESGALQPKAPFVITDEQVNGHERFWKQANRSTIPYLPYTHVDGVPPPQRQMPPQPATAEMALADRSAFAIQRTIGLHEASLGAESNERTGKAVLARQAQGATGTFHFASNLGRALEAMGRCAVRAFPKVYDAERTMRIELPDETEDSVVINTTMFDEESKETKTLHDLGEVAFDVHIGTGPSYATMREHALEAMIELIRVLPPGKVDIIAHLIVENMPFAGADRIAALLRKTVPDQLKTKDDRERDLPPGLKIDDQGRVIVKETNEPFVPPPSPEQETRQLEAQAETRKHEATMAKAEADKAMAAAKTEEARAKQVELGAPPAPQQPPGVQAGELRQAIIEALQQHAADPNAHGQVVRQAVDKAINDLLPRIESVITTSVAQAGQPGGTPAESAA